jgi:hypothetical protein
MVVERVHKRTGRVRDGKKQGSEMTAFAFVKVIVSHYDCFVCESVCTETVFCFKMGRMMIGKSICVFSAVTVPAARVGRRDICAPSPRSGSARSGTRRRPASEPRLRWRNRGDIGTIQRERMKGVNRDVTKMKMPLDDGTEPE